MTANYLAGSLGVSGNKQMGNKEVDNKVGIDQEDNKQMQPRGALDWGGASSQVC